MDELNTMVGALCGSQFPEILLCDAMQLLSEFDADDTAERVLSTARPLPEPRSMKVNWR
ncbi:MAG: hypothetical protein JO283_21695 [Bradyrhizobium sp.]|nr:hypothetical protein [Bradyrhizobium sp.]